MGGRSPDLLVVRTILFVVSVAPLVYIMGRRILRKQRRPNDCGDGEKKETVETKAMEDQTETSTATREQSSFNYSVFISFRGKDTRNGFTSHLHKELKNRGIATFIDSEDLKRGKKISDLITHIEGSKIFVPVFSKNYADSKWCLREIAKMVEINKREGGERPIIPVFYDVDPSDVKDPTASFGNAFKKHQRDKRLSKEQINEWRKALTKAGKISGFCLSEAKGNEAKLITLIGEEVSNILCNVIFDIQPIGIGPRIDTLKQMLETVNGGVCMIGICGLGGIGKTTLAMALYNELFTTFEGSCFLSDIRENEKKEDLPSLQVKLMKSVLKETISIGNVRQGVSLIKQRLGSKKVLLVLDDVDHTRQLDAFTAKHGEMEGWFGAGSKIIVTTRDKKVLTDHGLQEKDIYPPKGLDTEHSLKLFCHHAFGSDQPLTALRELTLKVVEVAQGLPLALKVFGPLFRNLKKQEWEEMMEKLKRDQHKEVHERLKISYDSLDHSEKSVFLDIAYFFIHRNKAHPVYMWEACGYSPGITLKVLEHKSLIKINEHGEFKMHDQIRDMGRMVVKEEGNFEPRKYSRLRNGDQILEVLRDAEVSAGNPHVQAISFYERQHEKVKMSWKVIATMPGLRIITGAHNNDYLEDEEQIIRIPSNTRWFRWMYCPYQMLAFHNNQHEKLCILSLSTGHFGDFGSQSMVFPNLKVLDLSCCVHLIRTPDLTHLPSLEVLKLDSCWSLVELDESIGRLKKLVKLSMEGCSKLKGLPAGLCKLTSLESLDLRYCESLREVPDSLGNLNDSLQISIKDCISLKKLPHFVRITTRPWNNLYAAKMCLYGFKSLSRMPECSLGNVVELDGCKSLRSLPNSLCYGMSVHWLSFHNCESLEEIPDSIGMRLECLKVLNLSGCTLLRKILPESIGDLRSLSHLSLRGCRSIEELPECTGKLLSLEELVLFGCTSLKSIPESIVGLKSLKYLDLNDCLSLEQLPECTGRLLSLEKLVLSGCTLLKSIPKSVGDLKSLSHLSLSGCDLIEELPECIGRLLSLKELDLSGCTLLTRIPESVGNLERLNSLGLSGCRALEEPLECIGRLLSLEELDLSGCYSLRKISESIGNLKSLKRLNLIRCPSLEELPESMEGLESLEELSICGGMSVKKMPDYIGKLKNLQTLSLMGFEETSESYGGFPQLKHILIGDCPKLYSLSQLPSSLTQLSVLGCSGFRKLPDLSTLNGLEELCLAGCKAFTDLSGLGSLKSLEGLFLIDGDGLSRDLMDNLEQTSFEQLSQLYISGTSEGSDFLFGLPKAGQVSGLDFVFCLTEELPSNESRINVPTHVLVEGKIVADAMCTGETNKIDDREVLEMLGWEGYAFYEIKLEEGGEIFRYIPKEGHATLRVPTTSNHYRLRMAHLHVSYSPI